MKKNVCKKKLRKYERIDIIFAGAFRNLHGIEKIIRSFKILNLYNKKIYLTLVGSDYCDKYKNIAKKTLLKISIFYLD
jgi:hypothetical protein